MSSGPKPETLDQRGPVSGSPLALLRALRPRQWVKNALVFLPFVFAVNLAWSLDDLEPVAGLLLRVAVTAAAFCALSGAVYLLNDLMDRQADRNHPVKRLRPIASGQVSLPVAVVVMVALLLAGLVVMTLVSPLLGGIGLLYLAINLAYSLGVKRLAVVDVLLVASGYVIRAVAGALVIGVIPSPWLYTTTAAAALFIVLGKRYAEVRLAGGQPGGPASGAAAVSRPLCRSAIDHCGDYCLGQLYHLHGGSGQLAGQQHDAPHHPAGGIRPFPISLPGAHQQ